MLRTVGTGLCTNDRRRPSSLVRPISFRGLRLTMLLVRKAADLESLPDADLVPLLREGDRAAFGVVIKRHNRRLYRVARSIIRHDDEAEDIVQETYVRAFANFAAFRGEASLVTWLTRIAVNEALDRLRLKRRQGDFDVLGGPDHSKEDSVIRLAATPTEADPEHQAARGEVRRLVEQAVDGLPEAFRTVFVMREIEEMNVEETSALLGIKPETVKTRLHRARRLLRDRLEDTLAAALLDSFPFDGERCAGMTERVMKRLDLAEETAGRATRSRR